MADPPASRRVRTTLEPDALSPLARDECVSHLFVETAPSGCTEVSIQTPSLQEQHLFEDSQNVGLTSNEERDDTNSYSDHWIPPNDLSALRVLIRDTRNTPPMPLSRRNQTGSASSTGNLNSGGNRNTKQSSPPMIIQQGTDATTPKNRNGGNQSLVSSSSSSGETLPQVAAQQHHNQPSTLRNVHRLSSLKKHRRGGGGGGNTLLNRLFCNSPLALSNTHAHTGSDQPEQFPVHSGSSSEENNNPLAFQARVQELAKDFSPDPKTVQSKEDDDSVAGKMMKTAKEKLMLYEEAKVRQSVQLSISETLLVACSEPSQESPPSFHATSTDDSNGEKKKSKQVTLLVGDAAVGSTGAGNAHSNSKYGSSNHKKSKKLSILDDAGSIQEPNTKVSMFDDDDDIAETASHPAAKMDLNLSKEPPLMEVVPKSKSREEKSVNSVRGQPVKTTRGLVIPSPFTFSAKSVFPAALNACYPTTIPMEEEEEKQCKEPPRRKTPSRPWPPQPSRNDIDDKDDPPEVRRNRIEDYRDDNSASPIHMFRMSSSLDDLETVPEASTSKETATRESRTIDSIEDAYGDETTLLPNSLSSLTEYDRKSGKTRAQPTGMMTTRDDGPVTSPLTVTSSTGSEEQAQQQQPKQQQQKASSSRRSELFRDLKAKYECKFSEQKDQSIVLDRLANQPLSEIEKLEGQIAEKVSSEDKKVGELCTQLDHQRREMEEEFAGLRREMEAEKNAEIERLRIEIEEEKKDEIERLKNEIAAKNKDEIIAEQEGERQSTQNKESLALRSASLEAPPGELNRIRRELLNVKAKLVEKEKELAQRNRSKSPVKINTGTDALYRVTKELATVKEKLLKKESEIKEKESVIAVKSQIEAELDRVKQELESKKKTEEELARATRELASAKEALAASKETSSVMTVPSEIEAELQRVKIDFSELTKKLVEKEKELEKTRKTVGPPPSPERQRSPIRPYPFPSPGRRRSSEAPPKDEKEALHKEIKCLKENVETAREEHERDLSKLRVANELDLKRERDAFRKQKLALEDKAARERREYERCLGQLRTELEKQIEGAKGTTEGQMQQKMINQRELEGILAESCVREANEKANLEKQIHQLRNEKAVTQLKIDHMEENAEQLLDKIASLEKNQTQILENHLRSIQDLRAQHYQEVENLRDQMQKDADEREAQDKERLRLTSEAQISEKALLNKKIVALEDELETERKGATLVDAKFSELEKRVQEEKKRHREEVKDLESKRHTEVERLQEELDDRTALEEAMQIATNERDMMMEQVQNLKFQLSESSANYLQKLEGLQKELGDTKASLEEAIEKNTGLEGDLKNQLGAAEQNAIYVCDKLRESHHQEIDSLKNQLDRTQKEATNQCNELQETHQVDIDLLKKHHTEVEASLNVRLAESNAQLENMKDEFDKRIKDLETELVSREESHKRKTEEAGKLSEVENLQLRAEYNNLKQEHVALERHMKEAEVSHNTQFEDLLNQLDLVEAEHRQALSVKDKTALEKDAKVAELSKQLIECHGATADVEHRLISQMEETEQEQKKSKSLEKKIEELNQELVTLRDNQKKFAREAIREKERACNIAREEMIEKAEAQFQQANDHYVKLRKQYDDVHDRAKKMEGELRIAKRKAEKLVREKESCEIDLNAEVAKLKSVNAKVEADSAQKAKEYRRELERLLQTAKDFESKSAECERTTRHFQASLATVVAEKDKLQKEYDEMKSVSEELMAIVEHRNAGQTRAYEV